MGRPFNDEPRRHRSIDDKDVREFILGVKDIANSSKLTFDQVLKAYEIKELERKNNLFVEAGDKYDETMVGFAEILSQLNLSIERIGESLSQ